LQKTIQPTKMLGIISIIKFLIEQEQFELDAPISINTLSGMFKIYSYEE
jgi:hypothetical protein